jgi:tetratricopeptide (TPR) repeat protein
MVTRKAIKANAMQEAMSYFSGAMTLLDGMPDTERSRHRRITLVVDQWAVFWLLLRVPEYHELLVRHENMAMATGDPGLLSRFKLSMGHCQWVFGLFDKSMLSILECLKLAEAAGMGELAGPAYCMLLWNNMNLGNLEEALSYRELALRNVSEREDLRWHVWSLAAGSITHQLLGRFPEAMEDAQAALRVAEARDDSSLECFSHFIISSACRSKGDAANAVEHAQTALQRAQTVADEVWAKVQLGGAYLISGRVDEAIELLTQSAQNICETHFAASQMEAGLLLSAACLAAGHLDDARRAVDDSLNISVRTGMKIGVGASHHLLGEIAVQTNSEQKAEPFAAPHFERAIAILAETKAENALAHAYAGYGRFHRSLGRMVDARDCLSRALAIFERLGGLAEPDRLRSELAQMAPATAETRE